MLCILAGMDQKDTYAVGFGGDYASRAVFLFLSMDLADPVSSGKYSAAFVFTAPVAEPTVMSFTVPLNGYTIVATATVVTSSSSSASVLRESLRRDVVWWWIFHFWWCLRFGLGQCIVATATVVTSSSSSASVLRECLRRDVVWWWKFHSCWCLRFRLGQREAYDWKLHYLIFSSKRTLGVFAC